MVGMSLLILDALLEVTQHHLYVLAHIKRDNWTTKEQDSTNHCHHDCHIKRTTDLIRTVELQTYDMDSRKHSVQALCRAYLRRKFGIVNNTV